MTTVAPSFSSKSEVREFVRAHTPKALPLLGLYKNLSQVLGPQKGTWAGFKAMSDEPPLEGALNDQLNWCFPRLSGGDHLEFVKAPQTAKGWQKSSHGFHEPVEGEVVPQDQIQGFLVPGVAFSRKGQRVGRGKGFYDRALEGSKALKVGVCYSYQIFNELPVEDHDISMDVVVTDQEIIWLTR